MPFVLLERSTGEFWFFTGLFFLSSFLVLVRKHSRSFAWAHVALMIFLFLLRPRSALFGRDGSILIVFTYIVFFVLVQLHIGLRKKLLMISSLVAILCFNEAAASWLRMERKKLKQSELIDYGDVIGRSNPGGFLEVNLNQEWLGEFPDSRIITDQYGFRTSRKISVPKNPDTIRIIMIGDSFVTGIRTDQSHTIGAVIEQTLAPIFPNRNLEVLISGQDNPFSYAFHIRQRLLRFQPDLILAGLTLGNDMAIAYLNKRGLSIDSDQIQPRFLPEEAYEKRQHRIFLIQLDRSLQQWDGYKLIRRVLRPHGIYSWNNDYPGQVSIFDVSSGLSYFYKKKIPIIEASLQETADHLLKAQEICNQKNIPFAVLLFPQRFQISENEWSATVFDYGLDENLFDWNLPGDRFKNFFQQKGIHYIDPLSELRQFRGKTYFAQGDMHLNTKGQLIVGQYVAKELLLLLKAEGSPQESRSAQLSYNIAQ